MPTEHIVTLLIAERDRLSKAIEALTGNTKRRGRPPKNPLGLTAVAAEIPVKARKRKARTAAQRKAQSERMKAYWAKRNRAKS